jgi:hypothetical protein
MGVRITATYKRRDEPDSLIADLRANLEPWIDEFVELQTDREAPGWPHEGRMLAKQRRLLREAGAGWVLFIDPDERIEDRAADIVPPILAANRNIDAVYGFPLREMWTPTAWRTDGEWGSKMPRHRLFHLHRGQTFRDKPIHCGVAPTSTRRNRVDLPVVMYHLKNIEPANRVARAEAYLAADPRFEHQRREHGRQDWSWLHDETGLQLSEIEPGRGFTPPYVAGSYQFTVPGRPAETVEGVRNR